MSDCKEDFADEYAERNRDMTICDIHGVVEAPCQECHGGEEEETLYSAEEAAAMVGCHPSNFTSMARRMGMVCRKKKINRKLWGADQIEEWKTLRKRWEAEGKKKMSRANPSRARWDRPIGNAHSDKRGGGNKMERDMERWENRIVKHGASEEDIEELHRDYDGEYAQDL